MVDTCQIGSVNQFEARCNIQYGCEIGNNCTVKAMEMFKANQKLESNSIVHYDGVFVEEAKPFNEENQKTYQKNLSEAMYQVLKSSASAAPAN